MHNIERWVSAKFRGNHGPRFQTELAAAGIPSTGVTVYEGPDDDGRPGQDRMVMRFDSPPDDAALDAAIAAYPTVLEGVTGTFEVTAGVEYVLCDEPVAEGESVVVDVHVHTIFGKAAAFTAEYADLCSLGNRIVGGSVQASSYGSVSFGTGPGQRVTAVGTGTTLRIVLSVQLDGTMTIVKNHIDIKSRGKAPLPT